MTPSIFPSYLVPSLPFRRRKSSTDSNISTSSAGTNDSSSSERYLEGNKSHLQCSRCLADLASSSQIISKGFTGRHGRAYLVSASESWVSALPSSGRRDITGAHTVSDISCAQCGSVLGWKYVAAEEESQQYKVGKFILEARRTCRNSSWEGQDDDIVEAGGFATKSKSGSLDEIEFDSQDEDECEDLFMGIWTPQTAARRRKKKVMSKQSS
ncbi:yippee-domain-containing protein [Aureobasidium subglaciale]|nr:yippee-domain-containing protein [Aureobasidium subglaciale]